MRYTRLIIIVVLGNRQITARIAGVECAWYPVDRVVGAEALRGVQVRRVMY